MKTTERSTAISWTQHTWNPIHGCSKISEGCRNCYAERISLERGLTSKPWTSANAKDNITYKPHKLKEPFKLKLPSMVFVNSMSDLFHDVIPEWQIDEIISVMQRETRHIYQILTKRPERAASYKIKKPDMFADSEWPENIWLGTSVEDQKSAETRIPLILKSSAKIKFVSMEPMIDLINMNDIEGAENLDWIIVGGESGPDNERREMSHSSVWPIRDFCTKNKIAFYFKQSSGFRTELGTSLIHEDGNAYRWNQYPGRLDEPIKTEIHPFGRLELFPRVDRTRASNAA